jgi:hypothetical protein
VNRGVFVPQRPVGVKIIIQFLVHMHLARMIAGDPS